jgi:hypothetical protein
MNATVTSPPGWLVPAMALPFPAGLRGLPHRTGPRSLALAGSSPRELSCLFRAHSSLVTCPPRARGERLPWGFWPPSRCEGEQSECRRFPNAACVSALSVSHALDGLLLLAPRGLVSSRNRVRGSLFRVFPRQPGSLARRQVRPLSALSSFSYGRVSPTAPDSDAPPSGACSDCRSVVTARCLTPDGTRFPLEFSLPRGFLRTPWTRLRGSSTRELSPPIPLVTPAAALQRLDRCAAFPTVSSRSPRSSFLALRRAAEAPRRGRPDLPGGPP